MTAETVDIATLDDTNTQKTVRMTAVLIDAHGLVGARDMAEAEYNRFQREVSNAISACIAIGNMKFTNEVLDDLRPKRDFWWNVFVGLGGLGDDIQTIARKQIAATR